MPIYEYQCTSCGHQVEVMQKFNDPPVTQCPECGKADLQKLISLAGFQLKGTGWYVTDFKDSGKKTPDKPATDSATDDQPKVETPPKKGATADENTNTKAKAESKKETKTE